MKTRQRLHLAIGSIYVLYMTGTALFISSPAFSQVTDPSQTVPPIVLPTEVISATRYERPLSELPVSATVITREDILNSPGHPRSSAANIGWTSVSLLSNGRAGNSRTKGM